MAQSAVKSTATGRKAVRKPKSVARVKLKSAAGDVVVVSSIDANSETFADDFLYVFTRNVRSARTENKKKLGARSGDKKKKIWAAFALDNRRRNGSGKTTAYNHLTIEAPRGSVWIINPDDLALRIHTIEKIDQTSANLEADRRIESWLFSSVWSYQTVGVETVLSTDKYRKLVEFAKARGFKLRLTYVYLRTADLNVERVAIRVAKGGHDVPKDKIVDRRRRSLEQLSWFFAQAHAVFIFDNSGASPVLTVEKKAGRIAVHGELLPEIATAIGR